MDTQNQTKRTFTVAIALGAVLALATTLSAFGQSPKGKSYNPPTIEEIQSEVNLTETEAGIVAIALDEWQDRAARTGEKGRRDGHGKGQGKGYGKGAGYGKGDGQKGGCCSGGGHGRQASARGGRGMGRGGMGMQGQGRLALEFVADVAPALSTEKLGAIATFIAADRASEATSREDIDTPRYGRHAEALGLAEEQVEALEKARKEQWEATSEVREKFFAGEVGEDVMIQTARGMQTSMQAKVKDILTEEQFVKWSQNKEEKFQRMAGRRIDQLDKQTNKHAQWLSRVVGLSVNQQSELETLLYAKIPAKRTALETLRDGNATAMDTWQALYEIRKSETEEIRNLLQKDQAERLEAVTPLLPRGRNALG